jgi:hypothetical protein
LLWRPLPLLMLWLVAGVGLAAITGRARDWFDMTDEMRYERLAASIARTHSVVPRIHGVLVESWAQLYPLLISPVFSHRYGPQDVHAAHLTNAWVMSSACIPAFLLARRVLHRRWAAYLIAALSIVIPWMIYAAMLMTEVAAYPAFLWAAFLMHRSVSAPSRSNDLLALAGIALAFFARTALLTLAFALPIAILGLELRRRRSLREVVRLHDSLVVAYFVLAIAGIALKVAGRFHWVYGIYGHYTGHAQILTTAYLGSLFEHYATFALGVAILPFLIGAAWMIQTVVQGPLDRDMEAFAWVGVLLIVVIPVQVTSFDDVYNLSFVHDRFLIYLVPLLLIATLGAVVEQRLRVWALAPPAVVLVGGYLTGAIPAFTWSESPQVNPDTPASSFYRPLANLMGGLGGARALLVAATILIASAGFLISRRPVQALVVGYTVVCLPLLAWYLADRFFSEPGWSGRPVTAEAHGSLDWLDAAVGSNTPVTIVPAPVSSDWFVSQRYWRDLEFWNRSVARDVQSATGSFEYTGFWFPKLVPHFDARTGAANISPTRYVVMSDSETRFRISGPAVAGPSALLIKATQPWRLDWSSAGLYDDGWTRPHTVADIHIYPTPGQRGPETRGLTVELRAPSTTPVQRYTVVSNLSRVTGRIPANSSVTAHVNVCASAKQPTAITVSTPAVSAIPGDTGSAATLSSPRTGGMQVAQIGLADEIGGPCTPRT